MRCVAVVFGWLLFALSLPAIPMHKSADEIPPLAPPLPVIPPTFYERYGWALWIVSVLGLFTTALVVVVLLRPRKPPVLASPAALVRAALAALQARPEDDATLRQIVQALRGYLVAAFWLPPVEATTAEFCATLKANPHVGPELSWSVSEFLMRCDEQKFAPAASPAAIGAARRALELVDMAEIRRAQPRAAAPALKSE